MVSDQCQWPFTGGVKYSTMRGRWTGERQGFYLFFNGLVMLAAAILPATKIMEVRLKKAVFHTSRKQVNTLKVTRGVQWRDWSYSSSYRRVQTFTIDSDTDAKQRKYDSAVSGIDASLSYQYRSSHTMYEYSHSSRLHFPTIACYITAIAKHSQMQSLVKMKDFLSLFCCGIPLWNRAE